MGQSGKVERVKGEKEVMTATGAVERGISQGSARQRGKAKDRESVARVRWFRLKGVKRDKLGTFQKGKVKEKKEVERAQQHRREKARAKVAYSQAYSQAESSEVGRVIRREKILEAQLRRNILQIFRNILQVKPNFHPPGQMSWQILQMKQGKEVKIENFVHDMKTSSC